MTKTRAETHVELARSLAEHQRMVASALAMNAVTIRNSLQTVAGKLDGIAQAARHQVTTLDHALTPSFEQQNKGASEHQSKGLSEHQLNALSESLKIVPIMGAGGM